MTADLLILGAGGNSVGIVDAVEADRDNAGKPAYRIAGFLDDLPENRGKNFLGYPILGAIEDAGKFPDCMLVNGISSVASFRKRASIISRTGAVRSRFATVVHPTAVVSARATLGAGCVVLANSVICPEVVLADHVLILQCSTVNHHTRLESHVTLSAGVTVLGYVEVCESAFIGGGASIAPYVKVGAAALVGMGSVVIRPVEAGTVVAGNPARAIPASPHRAHPLGNQEA